MKIYQTDAIPYRVQPGFICSNCPMISIAFFKDPYNNLTTTNFNLIWITRYLEFFARIFSKIPNSYFEHIFICSETFFFNQICTNPLITSAFSWCFFIRKTNLIFNRIQIACAFATLCNSCTPAFIVFLCLAFIYLNRIMYNTSRFTSFR